LITQPIAGKPGQNPRTDADSKFQDPLVTDEPCVDMCSSEKPESYPGVLLYKRRFDLDSWHKATYGQRKRAAQVSHRTSWWSC